MRILVIFFLLLTLRATGEVWFVPGWRTGFDDRAGCVRILRDIYPGKNIKVCSWDSLQPWRVTRQNSREYAALLFAQVVSLPEEKLRELTLIGHSIGGDMVLDILSKLSTGGKKIHSAALLGAAVPCDDPRIGDALDALRFELCNIRNPHDWVLKYLYPLDADRIPPLGYSGWQGSDPRFFETECEAKRFVFFNHFAYLYLEKLQELHHTIPPRVTVIQKDKNREQIPADNIFWHDVETIHSWKLQQHYDGRARILDPTGVRRAQGSMESMRRSFHDVQKQLP